MIWQNAWAFAGLLFLALPVLIHLLSRKRAVLQKFPSLRFLDVTRLLPTRSPNLSDIPLLLVRLAIVAAAVFALAQPLYISATRKQSLNASLARVIVVDTSRSMMRNSVGTKTIADSARVLATQLAGVASTSVVLQTASVASALPGASAWLATQAGRAEIVVISDFQGGTIDSATVASIPAHVGFRGVQIVGTNAAIIDSVDNTARTRVSAKTADSRTDAEWTLRNDNDTGLALIQLFSAPDDQSDVAAAREAVRLIASPGLPDSLRPVGIVLRGAAQQSAFVKDAKTPTTAWMANALMAVRDNPLLVSSASSETVRDTVISAPFSVLATNSTGAPVIYAAQATVSGSQRLLFFNRGPVSGMTTAALIAAVSNAVANPSWIAESQTTMLPAVALKQFEREPQDVAAQGSDSERKASSNSGLSDGRWIWLIALLMLGVESWMRRTAATRDAALEIA